MERGKTFSAAMVLALLSGAKTQTRRLATPHARAAAGAAGDTIYVREHWKTMKLHDKVKPIDLVERYRKSMYGRAEAMPVLYLADDVVRGEFHEDPRSDSWMPGKMRQAMHMPRSASRLDLLVSEVRTERLNAISSADALAEGINCFQFYPDDGFPLCDGYTHHEDDGKCVLHPTPAQAYAALWDSLHDHDQTRWSDNPEVIVTVFEIKRR